MFRVRRAYAKGRLKDFAKTAGSTRAVPLRQRVVTALEAMPGKRRGILFPAPEGGRIDINNWRNRFWTPSLEAAGVKHRRIYDLRHTYATWSLAAGIDIFTLARRMGTSVKMIDRTYGHLVAGADAYERELLDAFDARRERAWTRLDAEAERRCRVASGPRTTKSPACAGLLRGAGATGLEPATSGVTGRRSNQLSYAPRAWPKDSALPPNPSRGFRVRRNLAAPAGVHGGVNRFEPGGRAMSNVMAGRTLATDGCGVGPRADRYGAGGADRRDAWERPDPWDAGTRM